ncbi:ABC transporter permease [Vallitalea pronyensis]|uniref:ABC transporter permease n=1 Tax=Vallitalea pronyensis TaxID=1348613 RepID=A0A8J8MKK7_9FIRM|nr:ABC transporter permease [Vallitalea pronyensis]QUI23567.1 ABC transporter permease [Vallitalea pronyensis]
MYFIKRALKYIKNKKGKTFLLGIIFLIIANFVLAGLLVYDATVKAQEQTRISIGANVSYQLAIEGILEDNQKGALNKEEFNSLRAAFTGEITTSEKLTEKGAPTYSNMMKAINSEYVASYDMTVSMDVTANDLAQYSQTSNSNDSHAFDMKLFADVNPMDFADENVMLMDGRLATSEEIMNGDPVVLIEEQVASINDLKIGDMIAVEASTLDDEVVSLELQVIGIYTSEEEVDQKMVSRGGNTTLPQNRFYVPFNILKTIGFTQNEMDHILIPNNVIRLKDPLFMDVYKEKIEEQLPLKYGNLDANDALYNSIMGPIEKLGSIAQIMVIIIAVAGASIIGLITALTVNERKEEIGIMLAVGESKVKIVTQFVLEVTIIALMAFMLSSFTGSIIGDKVSETVLDSDMLSPTQENAMSMRMFTPGRNMGKAVMPGNVKNDAVIEKQDIHTQLNIMVLLQLFGLGLLLSIISTILPSLYVMRFNPKQILINRNS